LRKKQPDWVWWKLNPRDEIGDAVVPKDNTRPMVWP
jgi:hypothetical protein